MDGWLQNNNQMMSSEQDLGRKNSLFYWNGVGEKKGRHKETRTMREKTKDLVLTAGTGSEKW